MSRRVLCLLPTLTDTRIARRVDMLHRGGFEVAAAAFERNQSSGRLPDCPVQRLGRIPPRRYAVRIGKLLAAAPKIIASIRRSDIVYAFNPDLAFLAAIAGVGLNRPLVVEVADVKEAQTARGWSGRAIRGLEKWLLARTRLLVLTTDGYRPYYRDWLGAVTPIIVIENKLDPEFVQSLPGINPPGPAAAPVTDPAADPPAGRRLRLGWFGRLRDEWTLRVLEELTRRWPHRFTAVLAGTPSPYLKDFSRRVARNPHIEYRGAYSYPEDLPALYDSVDLALACYPPEIPHGWSQSNRYYEACLFRKPLIVRAGSGDAGGVAGHDIGLIIAAADTGQAAAQIEQTSAEDLLRWQGNMAALSPSSYTFTDEASIMREAITQIIAG